jgi:hypothetical protein
VAKNNDTSVLVVLKKAIKIVFDEQEGRKNPFFQRNKKDGRFLWKVQKYFFEQKCLRIV